MQLPRGRGRLHPPTAQRAHLELAWTPGRGSQWPTPRTTVGGRADRDAAQLLARLCHRLCTHPAGKGKRRSLGERDFIALIDGVHQLVKAPIVLVWDRLNINVSTPYASLSPNVPGWRCPAPRPLTRPQPRQGGHTPNAAWPTSPSTASRPSSATGSSASSTGPTPSTASCGTPDLQCSSE